MPKVRWEMRGSILGGSILGIVLVGLTLVGLATAADKAPAQVSKLIEELGSPHYATRERAASELSQLGLEAFDALHAAQNNDDIEIAERARYLLHSMKVVWSRQGDSADVKRILKDYGRLEPSERRSRIEQLGALDDAAGLDALCRLVRYDMSTVLAKEAALIVMTGEPFADKEHVAALRKSVADQVGESDRPAAQWLRAYLRTLDEPAAMTGEWKQFIAQEQQVLVQSPDAQSSNKIVRDLYRWQAEYLQKLDRQEEAIESVRQMIALSDGSREQLVEIIDWLMQRKAWAVVDEVAEKHPVRFAEDPLLLYRLAEAQWERGDKETAEKTADEAFALAPLETQRHLLVAYQLQDRGRFVWSEREYRNVMKGVELVSREGIEARSMLAEMLHDLQRDEEAAAALADLVKAIESDPTVADNIDSISRRAPDELRSRMYFFAARDHLTNQRTAEAKAALEKGASANEMDADLLIAMHELATDDAAWKKKTTELITAAAADFKSKVEQMQRIIEETDQEAQQAEAKALQAMFCNQYAWLVGNTQGDAQEAIRMSKRSLEIRPESAGYMDTLAHCYFRAGEFENAVKWQSKAVKLEPHSKQIVRALTKFELAAEKSKLEKKLPLVP